MIVFLPQKHRGLMRTILNLFFKKDFIYLLLERGGGREKDRERNIDVRELHRSVASCTSPTGDLAGNPGMCPDWESNWLPFGSQAGTQSADPHQPGLNLFLFLCSPSHLQFIVHLVFYFRLYFQRDSWLCSAIGQGY